MNLFYRKFASKNCDDLQVNNEEKSNIKLPLFIQEASSRDVTYRKIASPGTVFLNIIKNSKSQN